MTGLYPHNHGVMISTNIAPAWCRGLALETHTFSERLKQAGYVLDFAGKWRVRQDLGPEEFGFDRHKQRQSAWGCAPGRESKIEFPIGEFAAAGTNPHSHKESRIWQITDLGLGILRERARADKPFFLRIDDVAPNVPNFVPEPYGSTYNPECNPPWPIFDETFEGKPAAHSRKHREWNLQHKDWSWRSQVVAKYFGDVTLIDDGVGLSHSTDG